MKQRFRARELWLFAPFLLIIAAAIYWSQQEKVKRAEAPKPRPMFVSDVKIENAAGYWQSKGFSHKLTVTVTPPYPSPPWMKSCCSSIGRIDPLVPEQARQEVARMGGRRPNELQASGGALTIRKNAQDIRWGDKEEVATQPKFSTDTNDFTYQHYLRLNKVPATAGKVTFHGLYSIAGQKPLEVTRIVRKSGEDLRFPVDKTSGLSLESADATRFFQELVTLSPKGSAQVDECWVALVVRDVEQLKSTKNKLVRVNSLVIVDGIGRIYSSRETKGLDINSTLTTRANKSKKLKPSERLIEMSVTIRQSITTMGSLRLRGKISIDDRWPMSFEVPLPSRINREADANKNDSFVMPLWRDGKPVKP